jgi:simple sugar transport system permease protein
VIRLERRVATPGWVFVAVPIGALIVALILAGVLLVISGHDPISIYRQMAGAAVTGPSAFSATLLDATPLLLAGMCAAVAFRMRVYNIGGEGQLYMGAVGASGVGLALGNEPAPLVIASMIVAGMLAGAAWAAIPGLLRAYLHTNEILTSLMLNYVAGLGIYYLIFNSTSYWRDLSTPSALVFPQGKTLSPAGWWPAVHLGGTVVPFGFLLGLVCALGLMVALRFSRYGFQLRVIGGSTQAGKYAGMRTRTAILAVMLISGALAGLAGASQVGDFSHLLDPTGLQQAQWGYSGIVATALGAFNPIATVLGAIFLGALINAGFTLQSATFPQGLVGTMEGIILFCVLSAGALTLYRVKFSLSGGWHLLRAGSVRSRHDTRTERQPLAGEPAGTLGRLATAVSEEQAGTFPPLSKGLSEAP